MGSREQDIQKLYVSSNWSETVDLLDRYNVRYVYIGALEKSKYRVNETKFNQHLLKVFNSEDVSIYEVSQWAQ